MFHLFVTHGGLNSIRESIALGVPMLVCPVDLRWDWPSNAAKVVFHGLGLRAEMAKNSLSDLENKINQLLHNQLFRKQISLFTDLSESVNKKN